MRSENGVEVTGSPSELRWPGAFYPLLSTVNFNGKIDFSTHGYLMTSKGRLLGGARVSIVAYPCAVDVIVPWFFPLARAFTIRVLSLRHSVD